MSATVSAEAAQGPASRPVTEREGWSAPGVRVLVLGIGMLLAALALLILGLVTGPGGTGPVTAIAVAVVLVIAGHLVLRGLTPVMPGQRGA